MDNRVEPGYDASLNEFVIASEAKQSRLLKKDWISLSLTLLAMTNSKAAAPSNRNYFGTTAVASISTRAAFSTSRTTCTSAIAG